MIIYRIGYVSEHLGDTNPQDVNDRFAGMIEKYVGPEIVTSGVIIGETLIVMTLLPACVVSKHPSLLINEHK